MSVKIRVLIIEDLEKVAYVIEQQLKQTQYECVVDRSKTIEQALQRINAAKHADDPYDLLLCDYNMGEGTNGQQLLEHLRTERLIPRKTGFIMVTAEASYPKVASAVELIPDGYLLKPFTLDALIQRVDFALEKRTALKDAIQLIDQEVPDYPGAIKACNAIILSGNRFVLEALKLKAECLLLQEHWGEAASVYDKIITWRPTPWAEVGLARSIRLMGNPELASKKLAKTIENFPLFVAAYDELAALAEDNGQLQLAQDTLEKAHKIVPSNRRMRQIGLMALENRDLEKAAKYLVVVAEKDRYGLKRSTEDFFALATVLREQGKFDEAISILDSIFKYFEETRPLTIRKLAAEAIILATGKRIFEARQLVQNALSLRQEQMEPRTQLELAEACYLCGMKDTAEDIFVHIAENWQEDHKVINSVKNAMQRVGMGEYGMERIEGSLRELIKLNNLAAAQIRQGAYDQAVSNLDKIAKRLLHHATVQANYVQALLLWVEHKSPKKPKDLPKNSKPWEYLLLARQHIRQLASINAKHRHLDSLQRLYAKLTGETEILEGVQGYAATQEASTQEKNC